MPIQLLDQNTINKIAAGEVVEHPASVVKELVENAIDAKATSITVEIKDGGTSFIRVTDNGCGIPKEEIEIAFLRHSTSKIRTVTDLLTVSSLGFRGEALASISSVAQVELISKTPQSLTATRYVIEGGEKKTLEDIGAPSGTTFIVRNLFYNTPARRKFLKSNNTEASYVSDMMEHIAMSHPEISFRFINNNSNKLHTYGNGNLREIIYSIYGREIENNLIPIDCKNDYMHITGFIGKPSISRGNKNYITYYINNRYIKSNVLNSAITEAYSSFLMAHRYPFTALHISINPEIIDVNVHPAKMELRFSNSDDVKSFTYDAIYYALSQNDLVPEVSIDYVQVPVFAEQIEEQASSAKNIQDDIRNKSEITKTEKVEDISVKNTNTRIAEPFEVNRYNAEKVYERMYSYPVEKQMELDILAENYAKYDTKQETLFEMKDVEVKKNKARIVGQVFNTYWIVEYEEKMYIIDQHAAHEKVLYERFVKRFEENETLSQNIMPPIVISLSMREEEVLLENMNTFEKIGFEIEHFGGKEYSVRAVPQDLYQQHVADLLTEILDNLVNDTGKNVTISILERIATMACKAAVKGNNTMSYEEAEFLINELLELENPFNCPHGRPTIISMTKYELEKKFKRIL